MCCNSRSLADPANQSQADHIDESLVASPLPDGYWIEAFPFSTKDKHPDLIAYGLGFEGKPAAIRLLMNPLNTKSEGWKVNDIASLEFPVGMTVADLNGDGYNDLIICDRYGPSMGNLWDAEKDDGGRILWLKNPGDRTSQPFWERRKIGNSTGMHRLQAGHFTTSQYTQVMGLPIIPKSSDLTSPAPILVYTPKYGKDYSQGPESWTEEVAFGTQFRLIHDVKLLPKTNGDLDMILVAGREGIVLLWYDVQQQAWKHNVVGTGSPQSGNNPYWGSGSVDVGRVGDDDVAYIATCEAFHGNTVAVYLKNDGAPKGAESLKDSSHWKRVVIDNFGDLNAEHTGTIHNVKSIQVGNETNPESFAIACMGAPVGKVENQGVYAYTPTDLKCGKFNRTKVTDESAGRLAIAGFSDPSVQDIASISYYVPGYHTGPDPSSVRINSLGIRTTEISAMRLNKEVVLHIPRPEVVPSGENRSLPVWILAGKRITLVVLPPNEQYNFGERDAAKVLYGTITFSQGGSQITRGIAPSRHATDTTLVPGTVTAGDKGAVFIRLEILDEFQQGQFEAMSQVKSLNITPQNPHIPPNVRAMQFPFVKVENLEWANSGLWNDFEFYNVTGFYIYFHDDAYQELVHMQAWTLGLGETARFHNHSDRAFCEIHYCLSNGGGSGGMRYFPDDYTDPIDEEAELTKEYVERNSTLLVVPDMHEHGPLWKVQDNFQSRPLLRSDGTVDYPWHAWLASRFGDPSLQPLPIKPPLPPNQQRFDVWMAFEFPHTAFTN